MTEPLPNELDDVWPHGPQTIRSRHFQGASKDANIESWQLQVGN